MKNSIKKVISLLILMILSISVLLPIKPSMAVSTDLITVGTGSYQITVTNDSKVDDIIKVLGEPKLKTKSVFGGYAYTFYTDESYSNYLYIETTSTGKIISFGSVDPSYTTSTYSYGDSYNYRENGSLHGTLFNDNSVIKGGVYYNKNVAKNVATVINDFKTTYASDEINYLKSIVQHGILMYNAYSTNLGNKTNLIFDEEYFYINEQFKENSSSIRKYLSAMDKADKMKAIGIRESVELSNNAYYLMNPGLFATLAKDNKTAKFDGKNIAIFDYDSSQKLLSAIAIGDDAFEYEDKGKTIELTQEEQIKMQNGKVEYEKAMNYFATDSEFYDVEPQSTDAGSLVAGELKESKENGILSYLNAIRVAGGLGKIGFDEESYTMSRYKATLLSYRYNQLGLEIAHTFERPDGITDEFWMNASGKNENDVIVKSYGECISRNPYKLSDFSLQSHIMGLIDDRANAYGLNMGHRNAILNPGYTTASVGVTDNVLVMDLNKGIDTDDILLAWPSKGVTFMETLYAPCFYWNIQFQDKYYVTDSTSVKVTCLNTSQEWNFNGNESISGQYFNAIASTSFGSNGRNQVIWKASDLEVKDGDVYQIKISNLKDATTGETKEYTYRAAFKYADESNNEETEKITSIKIAVPETIKKDSNNNYMIPMNEQTKLTAEINEEAVDKYIEWKSSNPEVISVTQNGILEVKQKSDKPVTITLSSGADSTVKYIVNVIPYKENLLKGDVNKDGKINLYDALQILKQAILGGTLTDEQLYIMDYNDDGKVNLYDALKFLQQAILG